VIVITGASSGIGLVTARMAAKRCARIMVSARNEEVLKQLAEEISGDESNGGMAAYVPADVGDEAALRRVADQAVKRFGRIDSWINCAGVSVYGRLTDVSLADQRRVLETNFWGTVHGSRIAVEHLRKEGGALINIGSTLSDRAIPLQGIYCASKHAVKAYTDALRMELEHDGLPISVTLVKPWAIDTPYTEHAKNYLPTKPKQPPAVYAPDVVAAAILYCAEHPVRDVFVGAGGKMMSVLGTLAPRLTDWVMESTMLAAQQSEEPETDRQDNGLDRSVSGLKERGRQVRHVFESSLYTQASLHPIVAGAVLAAAGWTLATLSRRQTASRAADQQAGRLYAYGRWQR